MKKTLGASNSVRNQGFGHFFKVGLLVFLDIAQDCSLEQCLTSSRDENSRKSFVDQIGTETIFSILMQSNFHSNLLVFSCWRSTCYSNKLLDFLSPFLDLLRVSMSIVSFHSLNAEYISLICDLNNRFKSLVD